MLGLALGCSQYSSAPISVGFHNVNAKYNALLQANQKMAEAEKKLFDARKDNYARLLPILLPLDSAGASIVSEELASIIKKASMVAERHQNSKWLDDAYVAIAKARLLKEDYKNAIETFKYVNTTANDDNARHATLIGLMRAYTEQNEYATALRVAELLREEPLNKQNTKNFYLTKAYLHELKGEFGIAVAILEEVLPMMKKNEEKARVLYATAQLYEVLDKNDKAVKYYALVGKNRPSYELRFYATLNEALVQGQTGSFEKLLKDAKNKELQDKIYEAMASSEMRKGNIQQGIALLKKSASISQDTKQLPYTYLTLADLYYTKFNNYEMAAAYYDSCMALLPPQDVEYKRVKEKQQFLGDYVKQITIVKTEDSLQRLAKLTPAQLDRVLESVIREKKAQEEANLQRAQAIVNGQSATTATTPFVDPNRTDWYFSNPMVVNQGKSTFTARWGNRALEDNWRRSNRDDAISFGNNPNNTLVDNLGVSRSTDDTRDNSDLASQKNAMKAKIPFSAETLVASNKKREDALFELGKIFKLSLNEPQKSIDTFLKLLNEYPNTSHEAEALYLLCLLHENNATQKELYRKKLFDKFSDSYYARLLKRENVQELTSDKESEALKLYAEAYSYYSQANYVDALSFVETGLNEYPNSHIEDKLVFLKALLLAKTQNSEVYIKALDSFIKDYPKSQLIGIAKEHLVAAKALVKN